jgi:hypothetical protein
MAGAAAAKDAARDLQPSISATKPFTVAQNRKTQPSQQVSAKGSMHGSQVDSHAMSEENEEPIQQQESLFNQKSEIKPLP